MNPPKVRVAWWAGLVAAAALAGAAAEPAPAPAGDPLAELLASGELTRIRNPVPAAFLAAEGAGALDEQQRDLAVGQLRRALAAQTSPMSLMMQSAAGALNTSGLRQLREWSQKNAGAGGAVKSQLGVPSAMPSIDTHRMNREIQQAMVDPWARAIAAARALEALGDAQAAGRFYVSCLEFVEASWVPDACLDGILGLGPRRAESLLVWMLDNAESVSLGAAFAEDESGAKGRRAAAPDPGAVQLRNAALEGLGALVGEAALAPDARERAFAALLRYADGKSHEPYFRGAAEGLGRTRDPRAVEPLRRLAKRRDPPEVKQAALRGLVAGFRDEAAIRQLRRELDDPDPDEQLRAAQALYEAGDEAAFRWAREMITERRTQESRKPDIRAQVVRDLVELGGERARATLAEALAEGPRNDWVAAWISVGLLELGDPAQLPRVEAALATTDWKLDPRGFRSIWRAIKPFINAALKTALSGGTAGVSSTREVMQATRLVGDLAAGERARYQQKASQRELLNAQLRWQAADALGAAGPPGARALLERLLDEPVAAVRLSAARALAELDRPDAAEGMARAFGVDFGEEDGVPRAPEVRASLLRSALIRSPDSPHTAAMVARAAGDADPGVRLVGLVAARGRRTAPAAGPD